jgi:integrase
MAKLPGNALKTASSREKHCKDAGQTYWQDLGVGHLGYRRPKNGAGTWYARVGLPGNRYTQAKIGLADECGAVADGESVLTFAQAQDVARARIPELLAEADPARKKKAAAYTVADACRDYLAAYEAGRTRGGGKDLVGIKATINAHILPHLGEKDCAKLKSEEIEQWVMALAAQPPRRRSAKDTVKHRTADTNDPELVRRRQATVNKHLTCLKAILNRGFKAEKIPSDRAWRGGAVEGFRNTTASRLRHLDIAESQRLINASEAETGFRDLVVAALMTGARYGELGRLEVRDFNVHAGTLHVRISKSGKGRHIVLTEEGAAFFAGLCAGRAGDQRILRREGGHPWKKNDQIKLMQAAVARAHISPPISFHGLRHSYASLAVMAGMPLPVLAQNLGHRDTRMVEHFYGHLNPNYVADAVRASAPRFGLEPSNVTPLPAKR